MNKKMNIAYICADFGVPIFGYKGASVHVREMVAALSQAGHTIHILSPAIETPVNANELRDVYFVPIALRDDDLRYLETLKEMEQFLGRPTRVRPEMRNIIYNLRLYQSALEYLRRHKVDLVYERYTLFSYTGIRLANELAVPHILEVNAPLAYEQEKMRGLEMKTLAREMERHIFQRTDRVLAVSRNLQEFVASCGVPDERITILPNGVDPQRFSPERAEQGKEVRARLQLEGKRVIGFVGSLKPWHGTETLLHAFRLVHSNQPRAQLLIVGDGPARQELEKLAAGGDLNEAVTFSGSVPYDEIPDYIAAMDITVAPYIPNDQFYYSPIKIFEYMAMAKPVVAGRIGQVEEVIRHSETGWLFEPGNISQLAAALNKLLEDTALRRRLGEQAREWVVRERTWECNARCVIEIATELIEKREA